MNESRKVRRRSREREREREKKKVLFEKWVDSTEKN